MSQVTYEEDPMLKLYEMRREPRLRQARAWFLEHFHPTSPEDMMKFRRAEKKTPSFAWSSATGIWYEHCESWIDQR